MKTLTVKLPESLFAEIESSARVRKVSKSEIVRERQEKAKPAKTTLWSRIEHLVIEDDSLPRDISFNKKHLRDYGR